MVEYHGIPRHAESKGRDAPMGEENIDGVVERTGESPAVGQVIIGA